MKLMISKIFMKNYKTYESYESYESYEKIIKVMKFIKLMIDDKIYKTYD
jgi:hypothetical protein